VCINSRILGREIGTEADNSRKANNPVCVKYKLQTMWQPLEVKRHIRYKVELENEFQFWKTVNARLQSLDFIFVEVDIP
jgi:hypothetical protein